MTTTRLTNDDETKNSTTNEGARRPMSKTSKTIRSAVMNGFVTTTEPHEEGRHVYVVLGHPVHGFGRMALTAAEARQFAEHLTSVADEIDEASAGAPPKSERAASVFGSTSSSGS
jgi:hypothetical protein